MPLHLGQLVYTSFPGVGFTCLKSAAVPIDIEEAFIEEIVYRYWDAYDPPTAGYRAVYLHQLTFCDLLFGWFYNDGMDEFGRYDVPYFLCYYWAEELNAEQLEQILACLHTGPSKIIDRQTFPHHLDSIIFQGSQHYQAARLGVEISSEIIQQSHQALKQKNLIHLLVAKEKLDSSEQQQPLLSNSQLIRQLINFNAIGKGSINLQKIVKLPSNLQLTAIVISLAVTTLPIAGMGAVAYYLGSQSISQYLSPEQKVDNQDLEVIRQNLNQKLLSLLMGTGVTAILAGAIASWLVNRTVNSISKATEISAQILPEIRLLAEARQQPTANSQTGQELTKTRLENNLKLIYAQISQLLNQAKNSDQTIPIEQELEADTQANITKENILNRAVTLARQDMLTDRVIVYCFDVNWGGKVIAESIASEISSTLDVAIVAPGLAQSDRDKYRHGYVEAIANIYEAGLNLRQIELLERFSIQANLVAPILIQDQLFGLLIAHQCSQTRHWLQSEIDGFAQLARQVGWDLEQAGISGCLELGRG